ncbi:VOC family protein [Leptothermofonsia sichuanensis E412]|uniref:VOC family protein n=1 Tax=Leptothermofonsia sichuanensis TaxID=2917832 RepID=UPI001CA6E5B0|nr:VOC family protein [Leptothermofonsia sichuanensis]QZZ18590.1 VOC family protein [Leptothermofonsia sichuanensis E412]
MADFGLTHVALPVTNLDASIAFYKKYAHMSVVHYRVDHPGIAVAWITDLTRPFVIVLLQQPEVNHALRSPGHLGVACKTREEVDRLCQEARNENCLEKGPEDFGPPVGYWAFLRDPDGHILELSYGQVVTFTVEQAQEGWEKDGG